MMYLELRTLLCMFDLEIFSLEIVQLLIVIMLGLGSFHSLLIYFEVMQPPEGTVPCGYLRL